jgi:SnoaL-like domain
MRATFDVAPDINIHIDAVHLLTSLGAVITHTAHGTSPDGFNAEWREVVILTVDGDLVNRCEMFDEDDLANAIARFDELSPPTPHFENAATRTWRQIVDACNRRDADGFLALASADGHLEDRRKGLRASHEGLARRKAAQAMCRAPKGWRMEVEPVAIRGHRLALTRERWRDTEEADWPITVEALTLTEVTRDELVYYTVTFDPEDINGAFTELTARWIASGDVAHPVVIESADRLNATINRHDWDAVAAFFAGATYVDHRPLAQADAETVADWLSSMRTIESLAPDFWVGPAEILALSAKGVVGRMALKGTSTDGAAIEVPYILLILLDGDRVTRFETFDKDQHDVAQARFEALSTAG